jgi:glycosyltransferase involved in cell wall biosynthesis
MNIGLVIYGSLDTLSGGYLYDRKLVEYLHVRGDTVEIISLPWRNYAAHLTDNIWYTLSDPGASFWLQKLTAGRQKLDILIQDELNHPSLIAANTGKHPCPVVSLVHHLRCSELRPKWQNDFYRSIEKKYLQSVDGFIFNSQTTQGVVNGLIQHNKPSIVAYPPTDRFGVQVTEEGIIERAVNPELRILFLGNVMFRKGLHTLIDALKHAARIGNLRYAVEVVGSLEVEPAYAREMQAKAAPLSSFIFHGPLDNQPLIEKIKSAHVLVVPSSYEGFGIVYLEGMGFGLPAIGTDLGAAQEVIADGVDGFIVRAGNAVELAERLKVLAEQRGTLIRMSQAARERFLRQPTWEQTADSIRQFLQGML